MQLRGFALFLLIGCLYYVAAGTDTEHPREKCCHPHEEFDDCGTVWYCEETCSGPVVGPCPDVCVAGCFCKENFVRKETNGTCVQRESCKQEY